MVGASLETIFSEAIYDIEPAVKKGIKIDAWIEHSKLLRDLIKKTRKENTFLGLVEKLIPFTKRLQDSVKKNDKFKDTLWAILNRELLLLNHIDKQIIDLQKNPLKKNEIWTIIADLSEQLTKEAKMEFMIIDNIKENIL